MKLAELVAQYDLKDVFNADETGLFYRVKFSKIFYHLSIYLTYVKFYRHCLKKSLHTRMIHVAVEKKEKERVTVLFCCSATGEKLGPLMIAKAEQPRAFGRMTHSELPVDYAWNWKAWMTIPIWTIWLQNLNDEMVRNNRKILLFVDNCTSHVELDISNNRIKFLPANTTSRLQPLSVHLF